MYFSFYMLWCVRLTCIGLIKGNLLLRQRSSCRQWYQLAAYRFGPMKLPAAVARVRRMFVKYSGRQRALFSLWTVDSAWSTTQHQRNDSAADGKLLCTRVTLRARKKVDHESRASLTHWTSRIYYLLIAHTHVTYSYDGLTGRPGSHARRNMQTGRRKATACVIVYHWIYRNHCPGRHLSFVHLLLVGCRGVVRG